MGTEQYTRKALLRMKGRVPARLMKRIDEVWPATVGASVIHRQGPPGLLHSDVHIGNWYRNLRGRIGLFAPRRNPHPGVPALREWLVEQAAKLPKPPVSTAHIDTA